MVRTWPALSLLLATAVGCGSQEFSQRHRDKDDGDASIEDGSALQSRADKKEKREQKKEAKAAKKSQKQGQNVAASTGYTILVNQSNGLALEVADSSTADGAIVVQGAVDNGRNQLVEVVPVAGETSAFQVKFAHSGKCLTLAAEYHDFGSYRLPYSKVVQQPCSSSKYQTFRSNPIGGVYGAGNFIGFDPNPQLSNSPPPVYVGVPIASGCGRDAVIASRYGAFEFGGGFVRRAGDMPPEIRWIARGKSSSRFYSASGSAQKSSAVCDDAAANDGTKRTLTTTISSLTRENSALYPTGTKRANLRLAGVHGVVGTRQTLSGSSSKDKFIYTQVSRGKEKQLSLDDLKPGMKVKVELDPNPGMGYANFTYKIEIIP